MENVQNQKPRKGPKDQHFVPRCYLSEFVDPNTPEDREPYIWVFDKDGREKRNKAPTNVFTEKYLYTIEFQGKKDFTIEDNLSKIEAKFSRVMKTIKKKEPLSEQEHAYLCIFIAAQLQRTLRFKRNQEGFIQQLIDHGKQMALAHGSNADAFVNEWEEYKKDVHKLQLMEGLPFLANTLKRMNIAFLCSPDIVRHPYITSDDPCVLFNPDLQWQRFLSPGFGQKNVQLTLPLSPEITVMFTWARYHGYGLLTGSQVEDLNRMTRAHCDNEFVSRFPKKKGVWFRRLPLDPVFFVRFVWNQLRRIIYDLKSKF